MEYCFIKNGTVQEILVCNEFFAENWKIQMAYDEAVQRPSTAVGVGHLYHDSKFWRVERHQQVDEQEQPVVDESGQPVYEDVEVEIA